MSRPVHQMPLSDGSAIPTVRLSAAAARSPHISMKASTSMADGEGRIGSLTGSSGEPPVGIGSGGNRVGGGSAPSGKRTATGTRYFDGDGARASHVDDSGPTAPAHRTSRRRDPERRSGRYNALSWRRSMCRGGVAATQCGSQHVRTTAARKACALNCRYPGS